MPGTNYAKKIYDDLMEMFATRVPGHMQPVGQPCGTALCYEGCEGHGTANGLPQPIMELAERSHEQTFLGEAPSRLSHACPLIHPKP